MERIQAQRERDRERARQLDGVRTNEMETRLEEEEAVLSKHLLPGVFINTSGQRGADNSPLSIPFIPLKDLNVH